MTQAEQVDIYQHMHEACAHFYEAFDCVPERVLVYFAQKPHLAPFLTLAFRPHADAILTPAEFESLQCVTLRTAQVPIDTYMPSKLNWDEFLLYSPQTGRVKPEELTPSALLFKKMIKAKGYGVLVNSNHPALDKFYIFQGDRYFSWAYSKFAYECMHIATLKAELEIVLKQFEESKQ